MTQEQLEKILFHFGHSKQDAKEQAAMYFDYILKKNKADFKCFDYECGNFKCATQCIHCKYVYNK